MSELFPARSIAIEVVGCTDPARIREFSRWFDQCYIDQLKQTPGVVDVYRYLDMQVDFGPIGAKYVAPEGQPARYLTLYRIDGDDPWAVRQKLKDDHDRRRAGGELPDYYQMYEITAWDFVAYRSSILPPARPATRLPDGMPETILLVFHTMDKTKGAESNDWWLYAHAHDLLETPGMVQCQRYRTLDPAPADDDANFLNIYEFDADDPAAAFTTILEDDVGVRQVQGRFSPFGRSGKPNARGLYRHWDLMSGRW